VGYAAQVSRSKKHPDESLDAFLCCTAAATNPKARWLLASKRRLTHWHNQPLGVSQRSSRPDLFGGCSGPHSCLGRPHTHIADKRVSEQMETFHICLCRAHIRSRRAAT